MNAIDHDSNPGSLSSQVRTAFRRGMASFSGLSFYERFEHAVILVLTVLIVLVVASATWHLAQVVGSLMPERARL